MADIKQQLIYPLTAKWATYKLISFIATYTGNVKLMQEKPYAHYQLDGTWPINSSIQDSLSHHICRLN